ncbi:uncharacterized protein LOC125761947 isoform X2 [Anopheles funestus]|uniref:uncharacterized protein LOC128900000 precursor n=1 Tax=Anopheles funestus TaxID=62324 RepID=UPI0020C5FC1D|nr:uncharacterized protein LOC128900000 precursor [Anopheles funestus]
MRFIQTFFCFCALLGLLIAQEEDPFLKQFEVHMQIMEPSGFMFWTKATPFIDVFGVNVFVGKPEENLLNPVFDREFADYASEIVDGKFLIRDDKIVVKRGEMLRYNFLVRYNDTITTSNFRSFIVSDEVFYRPKNNYCFSQCLVNDERQAPEEVAIVKDILEQKILKCIGSQASKYLFFPLENAGKLVSDPERYVKYRLWHVDALKPLVNNVVTTYLAHNGVGFEMYTLIDKFKVLELGEGYLDVVDLDKLI